MAEQSVGVRVLSTDKHPEWWAELNKQFPRVAVGLKQHSAAIMPRSALDTLTALPGFAAGQDGKDVPLQVVEPGTPDYGALSAAPHQNFSGLK